MGDLVIEDRCVGTGSPVFIVAEVAQAHDGSLGTAHKYIDAVARTGVDAVKFQTHIASAESTAGEPFRVKFSPQDESRWDYWKRIEFSQMQWRGLADHARELGLIFLSTPFSFEAVDLLAELNVAAWKIGSGEVTNLPMLERMAATGLPILLSSGMASWGDLDQAVGTVNKFRSPLALFQCTTAYPCPPERIGLNVIADMKTRYKCPVGLSDHSGTIYPSLAAVALGAELLEVHVALSRDCFGPDVAASVTTSDLRQLVEGVRFIEKMISHPLDKQAAAEDMADLRAVFGKSLVAALDLPAGHILTPSDVSLKKPGIGIPAARLTEVFGKRINRNIAADSLFLESDFD